MKQGETIEIPESLEVVVVTIEDTSLGATLRGDANLDSALLTNGESLVRASHRFVAHPKWNLSPSGNSVNSVKTFNQCLKKLNNIKSDVLCIVDLDLGDALCKTMSSKLSKKDLTDKLYLNPRTKPGLYFALQVLEHRKNFDSQTFVAFSNATVDPDSWNLLKEHPKWAPFAKMFGYITCLSSHGRTLEQIKGAMDSAIVLFLESKGFGAPAEDRIREGTKDWFPPKKS
jgi:hypothetical protein